MFFLPWLVPVVAAAHLALLAILAGNLRYLRRSSGLAAPMKWPRLSVIIPARNEEANLRRLLPSLLEQDYPDFEVIVYDDDSDDGTAAVLKEHCGGRLRTMKGTGPPEGWIGKVHALYQATRVADGANYLFLDADAHLKGGGALRRLTRRFESLDHPRVLSGFTQLRGGGMLLVSLVPFSILSALPWPLVSQTRTPSLAALNGQCWMISRRLYHQHEPHRHVPDDVLEDVSIARYLKKRGVAAAMVDVRREVEVFMYDSFSDAWRGFRKNAFLIMGGRAVSFALLFAGYLLLYVFAPLLSPWLLLSLYALKGGCDLRARMPAWVPLAAPLSLAVGALLLLDSAASHLSRRVTWKDRHLS